MTGATLGYYVHHHGEGHRKRAMAIASAAPGRFTLIGTGVEGLRGPFETLELPDDRADDDDGFAGIDNASDRPKALHYAPYDHDGVRGRVRLTAGWIAERRPALMVVDVSVEIAMLSRLCATPTVYVRLAGARTDQAHLDAFRGARALLAPFDARLDAEDTPDWVRAKTAYFSGLGAASSDAAARGDVVVVAFGRGGSRVTPENLVDAATGSPEHQWRVMGPLAEPPRIPANLHVMGWLDEPQQEIATAGVVVGGAGDGLLGAVSAAGRPYVCIPEERPFGEQAAKAEALAGLGAAVVRPAWPRGAEWPRVLDAAKALDTRRIASLHDPHGAEKAARFLLDRADA